MSAINDLKEIAWKCNMELPRNNLVQHTFGNASAIDRNLGYVAIKPSGVPYTEMTDRDMVVVDLQNKVVDGDLRPSSDMKTHTLLYKTFPKIGGVVHTHSTYATAWAQAVKPIPILGTTHADHVTGDIPCTEVMDEKMIKGDYEIETGNQILKVFKKYSYLEVPMVLVACHGPFTWGETPEKAVYNSVMLEELARMAYLALQINPRATRLKKSLIQKHHQRKHGPDSYYGQG
jgi:L-ribulose-5-phosphate 4-epimerase